MDDYQKAHNLAKLTWMSGPLKEAQKRLSHQEIERHTVIRMWNDGSSLDEIGHATKRTVHYVSKYLKRFEYIYGKEAVRNRKIPEELPEV